MKRRLFVLATGATTLSTALLVPHALAQATKEPRRVGLLTTSTEASFANALQAVRDALRERGHVEGRDIVIRRALELRDSLRGRRLDPGADVGDGLRRHHAELRPRLKRGQLDGEPQLQLALLRPDPGHGRSRVAGDHRTESTRAL